MYSPVSHAASNTMTNKSTKPKMPKKQKQRKQSTPFRDTGRIIGTAAGNFFGIPGFRDIGSLVGSGIGRIFGSGDYTVVGATPKSNVLMGQVPQFSTTKATNVVCHREYLGDITGTTAFNNTSYPINPGMSSTFPWLAQVASNYSQYRIHGLVFEFVPLITDYVTSGAPGVIIMSTNYNSDDPTFTSKRQMENSEFAVSVKPTEKLIHLIECDPRETSINQLYTRQQAPPTGQDLKTFDLGNFQIATQGNPTQLLGELWCTYCVEFFKPELPTSPTSITAYSHIFVTKVAQATIDCGTTTVSDTFSYISGTVVSGSVTYSGLTPGVVYLFSLSILSDTSTVLAGPTYTLTTGTVVNRYGAGGLPDVNGGLQANGTAQIIKELTFQSDSSGVAVITNSSGAWNAACTANYDYWLLPAI